MKKIYVIVVVYNGLKWINRCISSTYKSSIEVETIIVDNGSTDGSVEYIKSEFNRAILIENGKNIGFGKANNIGIKYALENGCDYVYLLNQDAWLETKTIEILIDIHNNHPEYGILSPIQISASNTIDNNFAIVCNENLCPNLLSDLFFRCTKDLYAISFVMAAHWLISRDCLLKVGGFSNVFIHYGEDNNYIHRALFHNFKVGISPSAIAIHDRVNREMSLSKEVYLNYVHNFLIQINNINKPLFACIIYSYYSLIKSVIMAFFNHKSIYQIKYILKSISAFPSCLRNRKLTKKEGITYLISKG